MRSYRATFWHAYKNHPEAGSIVVHNIRAESLANAIEKAERMAEDFKWGWLNLIEVEEE